MLLRDNPILEKIAITESDRAFLGRLWGGLKTTGRFAKNVGRFGYKYIAKPMGWLAMNTVGRGAQYVGNKIMSSPIKSSIAGIGAIGVGTNMHNNFDKNQGMLDTLPVRYF